MIRVASGNDVLVPTKGIFEFETHLIMQDILPRFIWDKLEDEDYLLRPIGDGGQRVA